jgi:hypothetical protein
MRHRTPMPGNNDRLRTENRPEYNKITWFVSAWFPFIERSSICFCTFGVKQVPMAFSLQWYVCYAISAILIKIINTFNGAMF